jgi:hypothetical protein
MNVLGCLDRPTRGKFLLDGVDVGELDRDELADLRNAEARLRFPRVQPPRPHHRARERRIANAVRPATAG